ncbi:hypothetical protein PSPO01_15160 [Paraphaeosphaeria sporulosa]
MQSNKRQKRIVNAVVTKEVSSAAPHQISKLPLVRSSNSPC